MRGGFKHIIIGLVVACSRWWPASAEQQDNPDPYERGRAIADQVRHHHSGFGHLTARLEMVLEGRRGQTATRELTFHILEKTDDDVRTLCRVHAPPDVRGTAWLAHRHPDGAEHQWLYLPAQGRVRRLAATHRSGAFMGSEFSYHDLTAHSATWDVVHWEKDDTHDDRPCHVLVVTATHPHEAGYTRQRIWVDQADFRLWRVEYYHPEQRHLKTLTFSDYKRYDQRFWQARQMEMVNQLTGNSTRLHWSEVLFGEEIPLDLFDPQRLARQ